MYESMANNRAKCLAISQMIRAKSYNSCLIFVSKRDFYYYVAPCLIFFFLLFLTYTFVWAQKCPCFRAKLGARTRAKLSSLSSLLSSTAAKMLTSLALSPLLYLLCHCFLFWQEMARMEIIFWCWKTTPICYFVLVPIDRRALLSSLAMYFKYFIDLKELTFSIYVVWIISEGRSEWIWKHFGCWCSLTS